MTWQNGGDSGVVSLMDYNNDIRFPAVNALRNYWDRLRGGRDVPTRAEVDPRAIEDQLEYTFILERIAPGVGRFRLAGMHLNDLMGMEVRGMPLTSVFMPEHRATVSRVLEDVFAGPSIGTLTLAGERGVGRPPMDGKMLLLPLGSDFGDVSRALGCLTTIGPAGRTPRRFTVKEELVEQVRPDGADQPAPPNPASPRDRTARLLAQAEAARRDPETTGGFAEPAAPYAPQPSGRARLGAKPRLYVVGSDDDPIAAKQRRREESDQTS
ncbi:PAS domain-containing protein [Vannielia sp.]|uniref:PAS domain-containing protein n=1 Tax=Vannielia sp. TaxID=2813045 RepID=UPI002616ECD2|nr:PAS domain-containing protein [Vannielia sp.]MDF1872695.1 PAS domain-containing protein [Vannielia sp.]